MTPVGQVAVPPSGVAVRSNFSLTKRSWTATLGNGEGGGDLRISRPLGTASPHRALHLLGRTPCYHCTTLLAEPSGAAHRHQVLDTTDAHRIPRRRDVRVGFRSTVDRPTAAFRRELADVQPAARGSWRSATPPPATTASPGPSPYGRRPHPRSLRPGRPSPPAGAMSTTGAAGPGGTGREIGAPADSGRSE
ncbi:sulfotransferase [Kitasatospora sp. NPDC058184]|uniref:sulfotransferase n=1 Tax=Kitasatospora sp. NPDC058184 TaxID=3346370 RepID=UPI0036D96A3B